jgi:hypothetical protein
MRKSAFFFGYVGMAVLLLGAAFLHAAYEREIRTPELESQRELVRELELTDLCIFTEARYTRHPSQADLHSPFQDHPGSLEHFPSGSLLMPQRYSLERVNHVD